MINSNIVISSLKKELWSFFETEAHNNADYIRYVNSWVMDICIQKDFTFNKYDMQVTSDWSWNDISIPYQIQTLFILNEAWDKVKYCNFENYFTTKDKTSVIWIWDNTFKTKAEWTFTVWYRWIPDPISVPWDIINIPFIYKDLLILAAMYYALRDEEQWETAALMEKRFTWMAANLATRNTNVYPDNEDRFWENHTF